MSTLSAKARALLERRVAIKRELLRRRAKEQQCKPGGLFEFVKYFWHILEPKTQFVDGWAIRAICEHLEAVTYGEINRLLANVSPGFSKSLLTNVFWPAWEWGPMNLPHMRSISFSYAAHLTQRDNGKFRDLVRSREYQTLYGDRFKLTADGVEKVANDKTGWRYASSVLGVGTGERADRITCLPHYVPVLTSKGWIEIGTIVEQKLDVQIAGRDDATGRIGWQAIECHERNPGREIVRISWDGGELHCTPEHPVFVQGRGYVAASEVRKGDRLVGLSELPKRDQAQAELAPEVLQQAVSLRASKAAGSQGKQQAVPSMRHDGLQASRSLGAVQGSLLQSKVPCGRLDGRREPDVGWGPEGKGVRVVQWQVPATPQAQRVLFSEVCAGLAVRAIGTNSTDHPLREVQQAVQADVRSSEILLDAVQERCSRPQNGGEGEWPVGPRPSGAQVSAGLDSDAQVTDQGAGRESLPAVRGSSGAGAQFGRAPCGLQQSEPGSEQPDHAVSILPWDNAWREGIEGQTETRVVEGVEVIGRAEFVYNVRVAPHHNYYANGVLVHNCDDPHNIRDGESDIIRTKTVRWFDEAMSNRLNDIEKSAIVVIMQRVNEADVSGHIIDHEDDYVHLCIPMEFDGRRCRTKIGWEDPRTELGELAWPERYPDHLLGRFRRNPYLWAGQYQQTPEPRGGGLFKRDWWQYEVVPIGSTPPVCDYIVASLDSAYTKQERNDPSGFTVWGIYKDRHDNPKILMLGAWRKHLELHGPEVVREKGEPERLYQDRLRKAWGLVEWVAHDCKRLRVDLLLIEAKASGLSVAQEMQRLYANKGWGVQTVDPEGDKFARAVAQTHLFADGVVHVPASHVDPKDPKSDLAPRDWAQMVIDELASFPNGRYRDLTDSTTQAMKHLRSIGLAVRRDEREEQRLQQSQIRERVLPLYPT